MTLAFLFMAFVSFDISNAYDIIFTDIDWKIFRFIYILLLIFVSAIVCATLKEEKDLTKKNDKLEKYIVNNNKP